MVLRVKVIFTTDLSVVPVDQSQFVAYVTHILKRHTTPPGAESSRGVRGRERGRCHQEATGGSTIFVGWMLLMLMAVDDADNERESKSQTNVKCEINFIKR